jgi:hypothetical protein
MKRELFFLVLIGFALIIWFETSKWWSKKVEPFADAAPSEPVSLSYVGSVPGKPSPFGASRGQSVGKTSLSCMKPLLTQMDTFLKGVKEQDNDPTHQLLMQSVKADKRRMEDELKASTADPAYVVQLTKPDIFVIQANFNRLVELNGGVATPITEGFESQCVKGGDASIVKTYLNDARDTLLYAYMTPYTLVKNDYDALNSSFSSAYQCMQMILTGSSSTSPVIDSLDNFLSTTSDLEGNLMKYIPDPPSGTQCVQGGDPVIVYNYIRDIKDTIISFYSVTPDKPYVPAADDYVILNNDYKNAQKCLQTLMGSSVPSTIPTLNSVDMLLSTANDLQTLVDTYTPSPAGPSSSSDSSSPSSSAGLPGLPGVTDTTGNTGLNSLFPPLTDTGPLQTIFGSGGTGSTGSTGSTGGTGSTDGTGGTGSKGNITLAQAHKLVTLIDAKVESLS